MVCGWDFYAVSCVEVAIPKNNKNKDGAQLSELLIDVTRVVARRLKNRLPTGIDRVCLAYVERYRNQARAVLQCGSIGTTLSLNASADLFAALLNPTANVLTHLSTSLARSAFVSCAARGSVVLNVGHTGLERPAYMRWIAAKGYRPIYMVHDLIPITHPEYCRPLEKTRHTVRMRSVLSSAAAVLTNSTATLEALSAFASEQGLPLPPLVVAELATAAFPSDVTERPIAAPYFVMLSTIEPRKNHLMILNIWRRMAEQQGIEAPRLVIIGQRGWECENVIDMLERCDGLRDLVIEKAQCSDAELASYLRHAQALLFPSFVEGYGLPLIEALSLKVPVIASDLAVFHEIAGDTPEYLDPLNGVQWASSIDSYAKVTSVERKAQLRRIEKYSAPTWSSHFDKFETLLGAL